MRVCGGRRLASALFGHHMGPTSHCKLTRSSSDVTVRFPSAVMLGPAPAINQWWDPHLLSKNIITRPSCFVAWTNQIRIWVGSSSIYNGVWISEALTRRNLKLELVTLEWAHVIKSRSLKINVLPFFSCVCENPT